MIGRWDGFGFSSVASAAMGTSIRSLRVRESRSPTRRSPSPSSNAPSRRAFSFHGAGGIEPTIGTARAGARLAEILTLPPDERRAFIYPLLFGSIDAPAKIDELRSIVGTWRPDLVVHDSCDLAAPLAAAERDLPSVHHSFGRMVPPAIVAAAEPVTEPLWRAAGLEPEPYAGMFRGIYVDIAPPSFQTETVPAGVRVEQLRSASLDTPATERTPTGSRNSPIGRRST